MFTTNQMSVTPTTGEIRFEQKISQNDMKMPSMMLKVRDCQAKLH